MGVGVGLAGGTDPLVIAHIYIQVQRWAHRYRLLRAIDRSLVENGLKMVFLLRCVHGGWLLLSVGGWVGTRDGQGGSHDDHYHQHTYTYAGFRPSCPSTCSTTSWYTAQHGSDEHARHARKPCTPPQPNPQPHTNPNPNPKPLRKPQPTQGVTSVTLRDFLLGSFGMLPWVCTCAYIGSALKGVSDVAGASRGEAAHKHRALSYTAYALGAAGTLGVVWLISQYTRRAFAEVLREDVYVGGGVEGVEGPGGRVHGVGGSVGYAEMGAVVGDGGEGEGEGGVEEMVFEVEEGRVRGGGGIGDGEGEGQGQGVVGREAAMA